MAQLVGQSVEQIQSLSRTDTRTEPTFVPDFIEPEEFDTPFFTDDMPPMEVEPIASQVSENQVSKNLMSRAISIVLNYPILVDETIEHRVRVIDNSEVLLELVRSAQMDESITQEALLEPFVQKPRVHQRLQQLCTLSPHLSEVQAKDELLNTLYSLEKYQKQAHIKSSIDQANTLDEQRRVMEGIAKGKQKKRD